MHHHVFLLSNLLNPKPQPSPQKPKHNYKRPVNKSHRKALRDFKRLHDCSIHGLKRRLHLARTQPAPRHRFNDGPKTAKGNLHARLFPCLSSATLLSSTDPATSPASTSSAPSSTEATTATAYIRASQS